MNNKQEKRDNENYSKNFTRVPNIVFASYPDLSHEEKFLYCKLRFIYWDAKPRFVSLRQLSEQTGYSHGALGKMLPRLNTSGLIHAEIMHETGKDGKKRGKAKYRISIPDIWEENRKYFEERPPNGQTQCENVHQMDNVVHATDKNVHQMDNVVTPNGQTQAQVELTKESKDFFKESKNGRDLPSSTPSLSSLSDDLLVAELHRREIERLSTAQQELSTPVENPPSKQRDTEPLLLDEEKRIQSYWCELGFTERPSAKKHWLALSKHIASFEQMESLYEYTQVAIKDKPNTRVFPGNLVDHLDGWKQTQMPVLEKPTKQKVKITPEYLASLPL